MESARDELQIEVKLENSPQALFAQDFTPAQKPPKTYIATHYL